jgi:dolichol-phosphate mannosyltransferase
MLFGAVTGIVRYSQSLMGAGAASAGTVMLSAVPIILGFQLLLAFLSYDIASTPKRARHGLERD